MSEDRREPLPSFVREVLDDDAISDDATVRAIDRAMAAMATALPPEVPAQSARSRLLAAAGAGPMRHAPFFDRLSRLFDLSRDAVLRVLHDSASESFWEPGPHPAIRVMHFQGGPAVLGADTGLVRMPADFVWPSHRHGGVERALLLEGQYVDSDGRLFRAGDLHEMGPGSVHSFTVQPGTPLLLAVSLSGAIEILSE
jgi:hypothetical protein